MRDNDSQELVNALTAVCFQLGIGWNKKHKRTWNYLKAHDWKAAAKEAALTIINQRPKRKSLAITKSSFLPSTENEDLRRTIDDLTEDDVERFRF